MGGEYEYNGLRDGSIAIKQESEEASPGIYEYIVAGSYWLIKVEAEGNIVQMPSQAA